MCMVAHVCLDRSGCLVVGNQIRGEGMRGTYQVFACQPAWSTYRFWRSFNGTPCILSHCFFPPT